MRSCSVGSVAKAIRQLTNISGEIRVKRKYKTTDMGKLSKWWYIVRAEEGLLKQLDGKWEKVKLQTSWKLEPCYKQSEVKLLNSRQDTPPSQFVLDHKLASTSHGSIGPIKELEVVSTPVRSAEDSEVSVPLVLTPAVLSLNQDQRDQAPLSQ